MPPLFGARRSASLGPDSAPSPGIAGVTCAQARERTAPGPRGLGGCFRCARAVAYLLAGRWAACAGCVSRGSAGGRAAPRRPRIPRITAVAYREQSRAPARPRVPGEPHLGLPDEGQLGGPFQSGSRRVGREKHNSVVREGGNP